MTRYEVVRNAEAGKWYVVEKNARKSIYRRACYGYDDVTKAVHAAMQMNAQLIKREELKAEKRAAKSAARAAFMSKGHPYRVGDLFSYSWGYDQTNVEFFQCVEVSAKSVTLRPIAGHTVPGSEGFMSSSVGPSPNQFTGEAFRKTVQAWIYPGCEGKFVLPMPHGSLDKINAEDVEYCSWYA